jgi:subtilisin-like proprotein convertase family protein
MKKPYLFLYKTLTMLCLGLVILAAGSNQANAQCTNTPEGEYPFATPLVPTCGGGPASSPFDAWTGEYSTVSLVSGEEYQFSSSTGSHYITIISADGTTALAWGTTPVVYTAVATGNVRFATHLNSNCDVGQVNHTRSVVCVSGPPPTTCCQTTGGVGCPEAPACEALICGNDAFCCNNTWDSACVAAAAVDCGEVECAPPAPITCCQTAGGTGCPEAPACEALICAVDPFCCNSTWDSACVAAAAVDCGEVECAPSPPPAGDCCTANGGLGCNDAACEALICTGDPFCCNTEWDSFCAAAAVADCDVCAAPSGCTNTPEGQWPALALVPVCGDGPVSTTNVAWTGEYSLASLEAGEDYEFSSSIGSYYITIMSADGSTVLAAGTSPVSYTAATTGDVRFATHLSSACDFGQVSHTRTVECIPQPPVDPDGLSCESAFAVTPGSYTYADVTTGDIAICEPVAGAGVWYAFTAPSNGTFDVSSCDAAIDTYLEVYSGVCGSLVCAGFNDDDNSACHANGWNSTVSGIVANSGETYYIYWSGFYTTVGADWTLTFNADPTPEVVLVPFTGFNSVDCGTDVILQDHAGLANYSNNANGYTVLNGAGTSVINIAGPYNTESGWDFVRLYDGAGIGGTLLGTFSGVGNINFTSSPGQTVTVRFTSDTSQDGVGFDLSVTYSGACVLDCTAPTVNTSIVDDCVNGTFSIDIEIENNGDAPDYDIIYSVNNGSPVGDGPYQTGPGSFFYNIGPFAFGSEVDLTITHNGDALCNQSIDGLTSLGNLCPLTNPTSCGLGLAIPDAGCAGNNFMEASIGISGLGTTLGVDVQLQSVDIVASHTWNGDMRIYLVNPDGQQITLVLNRGGSFDNFGNINDCSTVLTLIDGGAAPTGITGNNVSGNFAPEQPLSSLTGNANGNWIIRICDSAGGDVGALQYAALNFVDCVGAQASTTVVPDCINGQYFIDVNVTSLGSAGSVDVEVNGNVVATVNATGVEQIGPFASGSTNNIVLVHDSNNDCDASLAAVSYSCPPANDLCANAISVSCGSVTAGTTVNGTMTGAPGFCGTGLSTSAGVWYTVNGINGQMFASLCGSPFDTKIGVFTGSCGAFTCIVGEDDDFTNCGGNDPFVDWFAVSSETYYIYVTGFSTNTGTFNLTVDCVPFPVNNDCANATPITPVSPNVNYGMGLYAQANAIGTLWGATASGTGSCGAGNDVFYSLNVPYLNHYIVSVNPFGGADVALEILDACGGSQLSCTNAAGAAGLETAYLISLAAGDYTIRVSGSAASSSVGQFLLNVQAAPTTRIMDGTGCNESDLQLEDVIRCNLVSTALDYEWRFVEVGGGLDASFMRSSLSNAGSTNNRNLRLSWVPGIDYNKLYNVYVRAQFDIPGYGVVWGAYREFATDLTMLGASECTVETGTSVTPTQLRPEYSPNNPVSGLPHTFCNGLVATWVGQAEQFQWELDGPTFHEVTSPSYFVNLGSIAGLQAGQVYQVRVRARVNGLWGSYGVQLPVSIGLPSNTQVLGYLCGTTRALNQAIAAVNTCGASSYTFRFQHATEAERIIVRPAYTCPLWLVTPALTPGETYSVTVKVAQGGVDGDYSTACDITIAGPQAEGLADDMMVSKVATEGGMGIYPNPNTGSEVRVELNGIEDGAHNVEVTIYDIYGKLMTRDVFGHQGSQLSRLVRFETELATGMYLVHVTIDGNIFATEKLIVK